MRLPFILSLFLLYLFPHQTCIGQKAQAGRVSPKELNIPASPVFDLMRVTPSQINRTSDIKDFKVDWSFKSWKLNPNLALQSQPFWEILYNRNDLNKYQSASGFMRRLASTDISIGSVQDENNDRRIGFAVKMNLFRPKDPLLAKDLYEDIGQRYKQERTDLEDQLSDLRLKLDTTSNIMEKPGIRSQIRSAEEQLNTQHSRRMAEINSRAKIFVDEHWNASSLDFAFGKIYTYKTDSLGTLKGLRLNRNTGFGAWLNGSVGIGKKFLLSGLFRTSWYEEELSFNIKNIATGDERKEIAIADNKLYSMGLNLRYGGPMFTLFAEFLYEKKALKTAGEALEEVFSAPRDFEVVKQTVNWDVVHPNTLSIGGDWRISQVLVLNYGMRSVFDKNWKFNTFIPVVTVSCMMR